MKKLFLGLMAVILLLLAGCSQSKEFRIEPVELSDEQTQLLNVTGNRVSKYSLKNVPNDETYELKVVYEVYKKKEKIKDEEMMAMRMEPTNENIEDKELYLNIQDGKIRLIVGGAYAYMDIEEDINKFGYSTLSKGKNINLGDEVYLFRGTTAENGISDIGSSGVMSNEEKEKFINDNEMSIFIKLVCEETEA